MTIAYIEIEWPQGKRKVKLPTKPVTIGRHPDNVLTIKDDQASRQHCVIEKTPNGHRVRDLGSRNGTRVNGDRIRDVELRPDDVITIGDVAIRYRCRTEGDNGASASTSAIEKSESIELEGDGEQEEVKRKAPKLSRGRSKVKVSEGAGIAELAKAQCDALARIAADAIGDAPLEKNIRLINARGEAADTLEDAAGDVTDSDSAIYVLRALLRVCLSIHATDLHIEAKRDNYNTRARVDGMMVDIVTMHKEIGLRLASVVKVLSDIDISQKKVVQEGHFSVRLPDRGIDFRVSFTPAMFGQKLVIRILDLANAPQYLRELNLSGWAHEMLRKTMKQDAGMVLVCGPTGSGKTTSLYALLREVDVSQRNVITIEDPVEYQIEGVTQIPIDEQQGNSFSTLLRSVLRQDPDVILVGEIRDPETARIAMQAAITGHLVLSTVHARDSIGAIFRLLDLGVEPYVLGTGLNILLAQRLVRLLCEDCRIDKTPSPDETRKIMRNRAEKVAKIYKPVGCERCLTTGYAGRRAIFETLAANEALRDTILNSPTIQDIKQALSTTMFTPMAEHGYQLVADGIISMDEVDRVVGLEG